MAASSPVPKNGAVVVGSYLCDFGSWSLTASQMVEDCTPYGATLAQKRVGCGTPGHDYSIAGWALAHAANTPPTVVDGAGIFTSLGVSYTMTVDTGVTWSGVGVCQRFSLGHARMKGVVPVSLDILSSGNITETWAIS